jgi:hypothetical protein
MFRGTSSSGGTTTVTNDIPSTYTLPKETNLNVFNQELSAAIDTIASYSRRADNVNFLVRDAEIII